MTERPGTAGVPAARRRRRGWAGLALLVLAAGVAVAWLEREPRLTDDERHLVGAWRYQWDQHPKDLGLEYEFRPDRTCLVRNFDPTTGELTGEVTATWRLSGNTLAVRHPEAKAKSLLRILPSQRAAEEGMILTPDGPDRFRYQGAIDAGSTPTGPPVTGTMTRVRRAE